MNRIANKYNFLCNIPSDINEHLPTLYKYATECESIMETGVRGCVSSWALVHGLLNNGSTNKSILMNDIVPCDINELFECVMEDKLVNLSYQWISNLELDLLDPVDLVFIDTWHIYGQLKRELDKFSPLTNKYIIMHDTTIDEIDGETIRNNWDPVKQSKETSIPIEEITKGLGPAITEFLEEHPEWILLEKLTNNNGLTVLKRVT